MQGKIPKDNTSKYIDRFKDFMSKREESNSKCRDCGTKESNTTRVAEHGNGEWSCEDCSIICEVCGRPHWKCKEFIEEERICKYCKEHY